MANFWMGPRIVGTALICGGLLVFQILSSRLLGMVLDGSVIIIAISIAMLGMGVATSLMSLRSRNNVTVSQTRLSWIAMSIGLSYPISLFLVTDMNDRFNLALEEAVSTGGLGLYIRFYLETIFAKMGMVGAIFFIPYFLFGVFIAELFGRTNTEDYHKIYAADLVGAAIGCVLSILALDWLGYAGAVSLVLFCTFAGAFAFALGKNRAATVTGAVLAISVLATLSVPEIYARLEPNPQIDSLARNYDRKKIVETGWHVWNAHSRIGLVTLTDRETGAREQVYAHENGDGWARVPDWESDNLSSISPLAPLTTMFSPKNVLVLFAGLGADMIGINTACGGACNITGVEINRHMIARALAEGDGSLAEFLNRDNIRLVIAEAREFLERGSEKYDAILLSWRGAGHSQYVGTAGRLAQYLFTKESFGALMDHLQPGGIIISYNGSKAQTLTMLRELFRERGRGSIREDVFVARPKSEGESVPGVFDVLESMRLVLKPSGFNSDELLIAKSTAEKLGFNVILSPDGSAPGYELYRDLADGVDLDTINERLLRTRNAELSVATDDRPFMDEFLPKRRYLDVAGWFSGEFVSLEWTYIRGFIQFTLALSVASLVLIIGPLLLRAGPQRSRTNAVNLVYFAVLGVGFMAIEVGFVRKFGLILGHPANAISIVLAALILSTGIGSLASRWVAASGLLREKSATMLIAVYVVLLTVSYPHFVSSIIVLPVHIKAVVTIAILFPLGFLMGQMFPLGLKRAGQADANSVPWAWAVNNTMSTIGSAVALLLSFPLGFDAVLYMGAAAYAVILVLPLGQATAAGGLTGTSPERCTEDEQASATS